MELSAAGDTVVHTEPDVEGTQCLTRDLVDLRVKEGGESRVHREARRVALSEVHARGEHGDSLLAALLNRHRLQLIMDRHVLWCIDGELQSHVLQGLRHLHATGEVDDAPLTGDGDRFHVLPADVNDRARTWSQQMRTARVTGDLTHVPGDEAYVLASVACAARPSDVVPVNAQACAGAADDRGRRLFRRQTGRLDAPGGDIRRTVSHV